MIRKVVCFTVLVALCGLCFCQDAEARLFGRHPRARNTVRKVLAIPAGCTNRTAQGVAEIMAKLRCVGHFGGNPGYEGCGSGSTAAAAYANCCYANSGMRTVDHGVAQGPDGMFYCCRRYQ